jgi:hypothetical protein
LAAFFFSKLKIIREPHIEFARQQTRTQPPPRGFASAKHRSGLTRSAKRAEGRVVAARVTQVGQNWNQLILELNAWYLFGRDLEDATNGKGNRTLMPVA